MERDKYEFLNGFVTPAYLYIENEEVEKYWVDSQSLYYYINDLIGFEVYSDDGKFLGTLDDIFNTGANDIYQVGDILLPAIKDVIKQIDTDNQKIIIHLIDGLI